MKRNERIARYGVKNYVNVCLHRRVTKADYVKYGKEKVKLDLGEVLGKLRKTPLIERDFRPIPTHIRKTYTRTGQGEKLYQLVISGAFRNEKTREVKEMTRYSHPGTEKNFSERYNDAIVCPTAEPETNWVLITDPGDPDFIVIKYEWYIYGGKKGISPTYAEWLEGKR